MKILIVDDHPIVRAGLRRLLAEEPDIDIREAATGREALGIVGEQRPDVVVLDLNMPGIGGLEVIARLKAECAAVRILVLTMHDDAIHVSRALQAGAAGYVSKNAMPGEILDAIRRVAGGRTYIQHDIAQELALLSVRTPAQLLNDLSRRDLEILRLLGEGRSLSQIAASVGISYKTVANNCAQIKGKLGVQRTAELVRIAVLFGIGQGGASSSSADDVRRQS
jgi:DNA-binding NarL/FixJ family response regulator